jgi:protein-disulfide isomerase
MWLSLCVVVMGASSMTSTAQTVESASVEDLEREVEDLRVELDEVRKDLDEVLALAPIQALILENRPLDIVVDISESPSNGAADSPVTIVEFSDFQCPYCGRHSRDTYPALKEKYVDTGKLQYVFMDYPLPNHTQAPKAAEAAHCAGEQGLYWEMHDVLFANQGDLAEASLAGHAVSVGLDEATFTECLDSGKYSSKIESGKAEAQRLRVRGTPSFGLGLTNEDGTVRVVKLIRGAQPLAAFEKGIDELLEAASGSR